MLKSLRYVRSRLRSTTYRVAVRLAQSILSRFGLELTQAGTQKALKAELRKNRRRWQPAALRQPGFSPRTVVDVGVDEGTPALYAAFPNAFQVLVEPVKENEPHLQRILQEYNGQYFLTAIGAREEELIINVDPKQTHRSSFRPRTDLTSTGDPVEKRKIPVTTLDALLDKYNFQAPFGLKIDTEGFEYQVIEGATNFLRDTQFVIAEVNVAEVYEGSYSFAEFIEKMAENRFTLCDILYIRRVGLPPGEILYVDAVFKRADSPPEEGQIHQLDGVRRN